MSRVPGDGRTRDPAVLYPRRGYARTQALHSNAIKMVQVWFFKLFRFLGPDIIDFGPIPGKAPAGAPLDLHRFSGRQTNYTAVP